MVNLGKITTTNSFPAKSTRVLGGILALTNKAYLDRIRTTYYIEEHTLLEEHTTESLLPNIKSNNRSIQVAPPYGPTLTIANLKGKTNITSMISYLSKKK